MDALRAADEVFITGTTVEITPVVAIDQQKVADGIIGPITQQLQEAFERKFLSIFKLQLPALIHENHTMGFNIHAN